MDEPRQDTRAELNPLPFSRLLQLPFPLPADPAPATATSTSTAPVRQPSSQKEAAVAPPQTATPEQSAFATGTAVSILLQQPSVVSAYHPPPSAVEPKASAPEPAQAQDAARRTQLAQQLQTLAQQRQAHGKVPSQGRS